MDGWIVHSEDPARVILKTLACIVEFFSCRVIVEWLTELQGWD